MSRKQAGTPASKPTHLGTWLLSGFLVERNCETSHIPKKDTRRMLVFILDRDAMHSFHAEKVVLGLDQVFLHLYCKWELLNISKTINNFP